MWFTRDLVAISSKSGNHIEAEIYLHIVNQRYMLEQIAVAISMSTGGAETSMKRQQNHCRNFFLK